MVAAQAEKRQFLGASGTLTTPVKPSTAHYLISVQCIRAAEPQFIPSTMHIPEDVYHF